MIHGATRGVAEYCKEKRKNKEMEGIEECCAADPCKLMNIGNGGATELNYVQTLRQHFIRATGWAPHFVIDSEDLRTKLAVDLNISHHLV